MLYQPKTTSFTPVVSARTDQASEGAPVGELLARYWRLEKTAAEIQDEIDQTVQSVMRRIGEDIARAENGDELVEGTVADDSWPKMPLVTPKIRTRSEFQRRAAVARHFRLPQKVLTGSNFVEGVRPDELDRLEALDLELAVTKMQLAGVEWEITERVPESKDEAVAKLRFISALLIDNGEIEVDHFAYLVRECADVMAE